MAERADESMNSVAGRLLMASESNKLTNVNRVLCFARTLCLEDKGQMLGYDAVSFLSLHKTVGKIKSARDVVT